MFLKLKLMTNLKKLKKYKFSFHVDIKLNNKYEKDLLVQFFYHHF